MDALNDLRVVTVTMVKAILVTGPNSGKFKATLKKNAPELWSEVEDLIAALKESKTSDSNSSGSLQAVADGSSTATMTFNLDEGDELSVCYHLLTNNNNY
eukprot:1308719-Amphidinium_carterae.1